MQVLVGGIPANEDFSTDVATAQDPCPDVMGMAEL
jgi:hypothetical protein